MSSDDLDQLIAELDGSRRPAPATEGRLDEWLKLVAERQASDLLLLPGEPPALRIQGRIVRTDGAVLDGVDVEEMVAAVLEDCLAGLVKRGIVDRAEAALRANHPDDFAHALA